jgi:hypothetical protein
VKIKSPSYADVESWVDLSTLLIASAMTMHADLAGFVLTRFRAVW